MQDRQPTKPNRVKLTLDDGTVLSGVLVRDDSPTVTGTPINKNTLFSNKNTERYGCDLPSEAFELIGKVWGPFTLAAAGWSSSVDADGYYTQRINVEGMSEEYYPTAVPVYSSATLKDDEKVAFGCVDVIETYNGYIVCKSTFQNEINVNFLLVGV